MRVKSELWVQAYLRRCQINGAFAVVARRGQRDGGAIFVKINLLDGNVALYGPAPAGLDGSETDRHWTHCMGESATSEADAERYLDRQMSFDSDIWIIEVEDRAGRHFLGDALARD